MSKVKRLCLSWVNLKPSRSSFATVGAGDFFGSSLENGFRNQSSHPHIHNSSLDSGLGPSIAYMTTVAISPGTHGPTAKFRGFSLRCVYP